MKKPEFVVLPRLRTCPFCGAPNPQIVGRGTFRYGIACSACGIIVEPPLGRVAALLIRAAKLLAIKVWNQRAR
jgi:transcription elongation factor Elf1